MDAKQLQRFKNEARAAASLHHEHIVPVFGVGCERGVHYYAMQLDRGNDAGGGDRKGETRNLPHPPAPLSHKGRGGERNPAAFLPPSPLVGEGGWGGEGKPAAPTALIAAISTEPGAQPAEPRVLPHGRSTHRRRCRTPWNTPTRSRHRPPGR